MKRRGWLVWFGGALLVGGAAFLLLYAREVHQANESQSHAREWLSRTRVVPRKASRGEALGELEIPRLHVSVMVFEGDDAAILRLGAGHIPATALPPGKGNVGIAAHRDTYFGALQGIRDGDSIVFTTPAGISRYEVTRLSIVAPTSVEVLQPAPGRDLTLVTCYPFHFVGRAPQRFIVHARVLSKSPH